MTKKDTNIVKCIAILLVFVHHLFYDVNLDQYGIIYGPIFSSSTDLSLFGFFAKVSVSLFVFLSAYGTTKSFESLQIGGGEDYLIATSKNAGKRYFKLLLSFQFVFCLVVIIGLLLGHSLHEVYGEPSFASMFNFLVDFSGLSNIMGTATYNGTWWYMSYALMLVACMPLFCLLCKKLGNWILIISFFLIRYFAVDFTFFWYMLTVFAGIICAQNQYFEKIVQFYESASLAKKVLLIVGCLFLLWACSQMRCFVQQGWDVLEMLICVLTCILICVLVGRIPVLSTILAFIGKHSMNMFLTHSFIFYYWFRDFTYSFRFPMLILAVLTAETIIISIVIELIKKAIRLDRFSSLISQKAEHILFP